MTGFMNGDLFFIACHPSHVHCIDQLLQMLSMVILDDPTTYINMHKN